MSALVEAGIEARKDDFVPASQNLELEDIEPQNTSQVSILNFISYQLFSEGLVHNSRAFYA